MAYSASFKMRVTEHICKKEYKYRITQPLLNLCKDHTEYFGYAIEGFNRGVTECQSSFSNHRWNCSTFNVDSEFMLFNTIMSRGRNCFF